MKEYKNRDEVEEEYKWDLSEFFESNEAFFKASEEVDSKIDIFNDYRGCTKDSNKLYEYLIKLREVETIVEKMDAYAWLKNDEELGKKESLEMLSKSKDAVAKINNVNSFFEPELLKLSKDEFENLFRENSKLEEYRAFLLDIYRNKEHTLNESEEKIVNSLVMATNNFSDMSSTLLNMEHDYGKVTLADGKMVTLSTTNSRFLKSNDNRETRKEADTKLLKKGLEYGSTSAELLNSYVKLKDTLANIYHFNDSFEARLFEDNLNKNIFDVLSKTTRSGVNTLQKYFKLRKKILNLDTLYNYDLGAKLSHSKKEYSIKEGIKTVREALKPLGKEYLNKYDKLIKNRNIDFCGYSGKCSGGYNLSIPSCDSRILMSYHYDLESLSIIAHEAGHHINYQFIRENNPLQYCHNAIIMGEVASLTNEFLLSNYIFNNAKDKEEKVLALENSLNVIASNLFGAVREGDMERLMHDKVHEGGALTKEFMNEISEESLKYYYGDTVKLTSYAKGSWIFRSHYYSNFYLYNYAICVSVASYFASKITDGDKETLDKYLEFLKFGSDIYPLDAFKKLGISLEDENVYKNAIFYFDKLISMLESLY